MQIRELEAQLGVELVERRPGEAVLSAVGAEVARRAGQIVAAARDLEDFARHRTRVLAGSLRLGVIPTLAPYVLPRILPPLHREYPELRLELRETQTKALTAELLRGTLDAVMLALPIEEAELETLRLFEDPFLLATPANDPLPPTARVGAADVEGRRLILLEEGHCLRDQALTFCATARRDATTSLAATSLATVMQMVASGYGVTLVPQVAVDTEVRDERIKLLRFAEPRPARTVGLAWRRTSPRKADFTALGELMIDTLANPRGRRLSASRRVSAK